MDRGRKTGHVANRYLATSYKTSVLYITNYGNPSCLDCTIPMDKILITVTIFRVHSATVTLSRKCSENGCITLCRKNL